jgi:hypothetical protein
VLSVARNAWVREGAIYRHVPYVTYCSFNGARVHLMRSLQHVHCVQAISGPLIASRTLYYVLLIIIPFAITSQRNPTAAEKPQFGQVWFSGLSLIRSTKPLNLANLLLHFPQSILDTFTTVQLEAPPTTCQYIMNDPGASLASLPHDILLVVVEYSAPEDSLRLVQVSPMCLTPWQFASSNMGC